ncbi:DUF4245 domain-containing protein [Arthrobacter psychrochitiniphilus]|uniref:DUF4245 domain-containing protein n=1 Tax=Arthrobacter psychrochitiniphilus TaxID=291045 RepID=A0A2V3DWX9_9MICC|nr:DUF4245 domain-containing protein [Arthrobacter psychrochitiniphilus]NYG16501.1 hypothetical protein [Arthrobacter psychrochitiniphilus]PXA69365.1 DUF4245 domain-containing protein [Arthrobacter psychrochitiniphilus]
MSDSSPTPPFKPTIAAGAAKRANASLVGMLLAIFSTIAIVLTIVWLNPQQKAENYRMDIDVSAVAKHAADTAGFAPVAPLLPDGWYANYARWNPAGADGVAFWDVGYVTASNTFIALRQSITANPTWTADQSSNAPITGTRAINGHEWEVRDKPKGDRSLILNSGDNTVILTGAADFADFDFLAKAATDSLSNGK